MIKHLHIQTPLSQAYRLKQQLQKDIFFKLEALQPCGSFKLRGLGHLCCLEKARGTKKFVSASAGNAGIAVAYSGMKLAMPTTVFIPHTSHPIYIETLKMYGATVNVTGNTVADACAAALAFATAQHAAYIHPFDHPEIWHGHATMIDEAVQQLPAPPDAVITAVGGGGLACGILAGMHKHGWHDIPLLTVETVGADVFAQSVKAKQAITLSKITSKATSLGATYAAPKLLEWTQKHPIIPLVVSDNHAAAGGYAFACDQRLLVELASGAALHLVYANHPAIQSYQSILVIVCGGINVTYLNLHIN